MRDKVRLFIARRADAPGDHLAVRAAEALQALRKQLPDDTEVTVAVRHPGDPTRELASAAAMATGTMVFDASLALAAGQGGLGRLIIGLAAAAQQFSDVMDPRQSAAMAGEERVIVPGDEPLVHLFALRGCRRSPTPSSMTTGSPSTADSATRSPESAHTTSSTATRRPAHERPPPLASPSATTTAWLKRSAATSTPSTPS